MRRIPSNSTHSPSSRRFDVVISLFAAKVILLTGAILISLVQCLAQARPELPQSEQAVADLEKAIAEAGIPPPSQAWQEHQAAYTKVTEYEIEASRLSDVKVKFEAVQKGFPSNLSQARISAKQCDSVAKERAVFLLSSSVELLFFEDTFKDYVSEIGLLRTLPVKDFCKEFNSQSELQKLQDMFNADAQKYVDMLNARVTFANRLKIAYQKRAALLAEEQKKASAQESTTQNLVSYLWVIVLVLGIFGGGILALVRIFDKDVQLELVASGQVIQFPTVLALLVVIISLGLTGILKDNTLAALLGGLAGYVLSQGVGRAAAAAVSKGRGTAVEGISISAQSLAFGDVTVGSKSTAKNIIVTNGGPSNLALKIDITGDYSQINTCGAALMPGQSCTVAVSFEPKQTGARNGRLEIDDGTKKQNVALTGTGT